MFFTVFDQIKKLNKKKFLGGNPAAVCLLETDLPDETKQKLAMEMNLSETAFVVPIPDDDVIRGDENVFKVSKKFSLRWFTPTVEVPLCGHATLASAAVLFYVMGNEQVSPQEGLGLIDQILSVQN